LLPQSSSKVLAKLTFKRSFISLSKICHRHKPVTTVCSPTSLQKLIQLPWKEAGNIQKPLMVRHSYKDILCSLNLHKFLNSSSPFPLPFANRHFPHIIKRFCPVPFFKKTPETEAEHHICNSYGGILSRSKVAYTLRT
jgi:hypothetical protein